MTDAMRQSLAVEFDPSSAPEEGAVIVHSRQAEDPYETIRRLQAANDLLNAKNRRLEKRLSGLESQNKKHRDAIRTLTAELDRTIRQKSRDSLTGAFNRDSFDKTIEDLRQEGGNHALLLIDLNGFKKINDTLGHVAGDRALQTVVAGLNQQVRGTDIVFRMGGDEFMVVLRDTTEAGMKSKISDINTMFAGLTFDWRGQPVPVHGSVGSWMMDMAQSAAYNMERADEAMYRQKARDKAAYGFEAR